MDLGDGVLDLLTLEVLFDRAILDLSLQADELALLERLGEVGEVAPGIDAVPFGAGFVLALVVLPALAGGQAEDGVVLLVLRGFGFCILSEAADEDDFVEHGVAPFSESLSAGCGICLPGGCAVAAHSQGEWKRFSEGDQSLPRGRSPNLKGSNL